MLALNNEWYCGSCGEWVSDADSHNCSGSFVQTSSKQIASIALGQPWWCSGCSDYVEDGHVCPAETGAQQITSLLLDRARHANAFV